MGKKKPAKDKTVEVVERQLPVKLTEAELIERGGKLADCEGEIAELKFQRGGLNRDIKAIEGRRAELAEVIEAGEEKRIVKCHWVEDWDNNCFRLVRQDTGESVDNRPMTAEDRQGALDLPAEPVAAGESKAVVDDDGSWRVVSEVQVGGEVIDFGPPPARKKKAAKKKAAKAKSSKAKAPELQPSA